MLRVLPSKTNKKIKLPLMLPSSPLPPPRLMWYSLGFHFWLFSLFILIYSSNYTLFFSWLQIAPVYLWFSKMCWYIQSPFFLNFRCSFFSCLLDKYTWILGTSNSSYLSLSPTDSPFRRIHHKHSCFKVFTLETLESSSLLTLSLSQILLFLPEIFFFLSSLPEDWLTPGLCFSWTESESVIFNPGTTLKSPQSF